MVVCALNIKGLQMKGTGNRERSILIYLKSCTVEYIVFDRLKFLRPEHRSLHNA